MHIKCSSCDKILKNKLHKTIFDDNFSENDVKMDILLLYFYIIFDATSLCCKKTLYNYIGEGFMKIYKKSNKAILEMDSSDPYINQIHKLLSLNS